VSGLDPGDGPASAPGDEGGDGAAPGVSPGADPDLVARAQEVFTIAALTSFRLNGQFLAIAEELSRPVGLTAARWQVLGAVLREPLTVAGIARVMGITRQSVQRIADVLVEAGLAEYLPNPAHRRAKLLRATDAGLAAVRRINPQHAALSVRMAEVMGLPALTAAAEALTALSAALDALAEPPPAG
jgi:DNA-binding MarR family transcriptional regulator